MYHITLISFPVQLKYLNPNKDLKSKETKLWCTNPIECLFLGRYTIFNFETFKTEEKVILKNHFKNKLS